MKREKLTVPPGAGAPPDPAAEKRLEFLWLFFLYCCKPRWNILQPEAPQAELNILKFVCESLPSLRSYINDKM